MDLFEQTFNSLYKSTELAFPNTTMRQYATNTIKIAHIDWIPYLGMRTLFVKGLAQNEGNEHNPILLFKNVKYYDKKYDNIIGIFDNLGKKYFLEQLSAKTTPILVRCNCGDWRWRGTHWNNVGTDRSLYGKDRKKYEAKYYPGSSNPLKMPILCKHLIKFFKILQEANLIN